MDISKVKVESPVLYVENEQEHHALALSEPRFGVHPGTILANMHLNLIYLDFAGEITKVSAVALLPEAMDDELVQQAAEAESRVSPIKMMFDIGGQAGGDVSDGNSYPTGHGPAYAIDMAAHVERVKTRKVRSGWKPVSDDTTEKHEDDSDVKGKLEMLSYLQQPLIDLSMVVASIDPSKNISPTGTLVSAAELLNSAKDMAELLNQHRVQLANDFRAKYDALLQEKTELQSRLDEASKVALSETPLIVAGLKAESEEVNTLQPEEAATAEVAGLVPTTVFQNGVSLAPLTEPGEYKPLPTDPLDMTMAPPPDLNEMK